MSDVPEQGAPDKSVVEHREGFMGASAAQNTSRWSPLVRFVVALLFGGFLILWAWEWDVTSPSLVPLTSLFGLVPLAVLVYRRRRSAGVWLWFLWGLNSTTVLGWLLFRFDARAPLLGLDLVLCIAAGIGPRRNTRWAEAVGCGVAGGMGALLALWFLYPHGLLNFWFVAEAVVLTALAGLVGEAVRRWVEQRVHFQPGAHPFSEPPASETQRLSRRQVVLGVGGVLGLLAMGGGATWLMRSLLPHFRPLLRYQGPAGAIDSLSWSPDGQWIVSAAFDGGVSLWEATTGRTIQSANQDQQIQTVAWSPDGRQIALGVFGPAEGQAPNVLITAAATLHPLISLRADNAQVWSVAWSPDSARLAVAADSVQIWEVATGKLLLTTEASAWTIAWSPNGAYLATADVLGVAQVWEATSGRLLATYRGHVGAIQAVSWSPDSLLVASAGGDATVQVWEALTGHPVFTYRGHQGFFSSVEAVVWSPTAQRIASSGVDGTIHVWEATTGDHLFVYLGQEGPVNALTWSPDGTRIASGGVRGIVQIWQPE